MNEKLIIILLTEFKEISTIKNSIHKKLKSVITVNNIIKTASKLKLVISDNFINLIKLENFINYFINLRDSGISNDIDYINTDSMIIKYLINNNNNELIIILYINYFIHKL